MRFVTLDFETFFSDDYTLKKLSTAEYIQDPRFEAHGAAVKWSPSTLTRWYAEPELRYHLAQEDWSDVALVCWHSQFDAFILSHHYGIKPKLLICPMSMARLLIGNHISVSLDSVRSHFSIPPKTTPYNAFRDLHWRDMTPAVQQQVADGAVDEVESIWKIFGLLAKSFPAEEYEVVDTTIRMFTEPRLRGDLDALARVWEAENNSKADRLAALGVTASDLQSADRFAALLRQEGIEPQLKNGKNSDIYAFAKTDDFMRDLLEHEDERVRTLAEARLGVKSTMLQTRAETLGYATRRGNLPVYLRYCGAHTTRWSGGDGNNWQNMNPALEGAILPPEDFLAYAPDSSQIECVAEGQQVLTKFGPKAIQDIQLSDEVWDGQEFVSHGGVVFKGIQEVISYQGLTATPEHVVYPAGDCFAQGISLLAAATLGLDIQAVDRTIAIRETSVRSTSLSRLQNLRRAWNQISIFKRETSCPVGLRKSAARELRRGRDRPQRQQWSLRAWQFTVINSARKCQQSLYDFLDSIGRRLVFGYAGFQASAPRMWIWARSDQSSSRAWSNWRTGNRSLQKQLLGNVMGSQIEKTRTLQKARVYDIVNAGPRYRFMVSDVIVSNCRLLNMVAGQMDKIEDFRQGKDPYCTVGESFCGHPISKETHPVLRQGSKVVELQGGYGSGGPKIEATLKRFKIPFQPGDGERWKASYRSTHPHVEALWKTGGRMIARLAGGDPIEWGPTRVEPGRIVLPNGCAMLYPDLEYHKDGETGESYWRYKTRHGWAKLYGAKLVENCLGKNTLVLTRRGFVPIISVTERDQLWDGCEWVSHEGVKFSGYNRTGDLDGVQITFSHEVLTHNGWVRAAQAKGLRRAEVRLPDGYQGCRNDWSKAPVENAMRLWSRNSVGIECDRPLPVLRVQEKRTTGASAKNAWDVESFSIRSLAFNAIPLLQSEPQSVEKLWRAWNYGLCSLAQKFREFLGRYGRYVRLWINARKEKEQPRLQSEELYVGRLAPTSPESQNKFADRNSLGNDDRAGSSETFGNKIFDFTLPNFESLAYGSMVQKSSPYEPTFDIMNCGPRQRFVVLGLDGPFIVHNCIQALARVVISQAMVRLRRLGYEALNMKHDAIWYAIPRDRADEHARVIRDEMKRTPDWLPGLPLDAEGSLGERYGK